MNSPIHIGSIIKEELRKQGKTNSWLAKEINVNPRTVNKIFLKSVIDTHQLLQISNFFQLLRRTHPNQSKCNIDSFLIPH